MTSKMTDDCANEITDPVPSSSPDIHQNRKTQRRGEKLLVGDRREVISEMESSKEELIVSLEQSDTLSTSETSDDNHIMKRWPREVEKDCDIKSQGKSMSGQDEADHDWNIFHASSNSDAFVQDFSDLVRTSSPSAEEDIIQNNGEETRLETFEVDGVSMWDADSSAHAVIQWHVNEESETYSLLEHFDESYGFRQSLNDDDEQDDTNADDKKVDAPFNIADLANFVRYSVDVDANFDDEHSEDNISLSSNNDEDSYSDEEDDSSAQRLAQPYNELVGDDEGDSLTQKSNDETDNWLEPNCAQVDKDTESEKNVIQFSVPQHLIDVGNIPSLEQLDCISQIAHEGDEGPQVRNIFMEKGLSTIEGMTSTTDMECKDAKLNILFNPEFNEKMEKKMNEASTKKMKSKKTTDSEMVGGLNIEGPSPIKLCGSGDDFDNTRANVEFNQQGTNRNLLNQFQGDSLQSGVDQHSSNMCLFEGSKNIEESLSSFELADTSEGHSLAEGFSLLNISEVGLESCNESYRFMIPPCVSPSPFETTFWQSSSVFFEILSFLQLEDVRQMISVNIFSMKCLSNGALYKVVKNLVRRGKCFGKRLDRGAFWTGIVDTVAVNESFRESKVSYREMLKDGENGKWAAIINRDVMRAFGTLPPHKTNGTRAHPDSIVRYLVRWNSPKKSLDTTGNMLALSVPKDKVDMQYCLGNILYALSINFDTVGYCQGMDYVVANLMKVLKDSSLCKDMTWLEEATFHLISKLFKMYSLQHMYWPELRCLKTCCRVLDKLVFKYLPVLADHFDHYDLNVGLFALGWFQTLFLYIPSMPSSTVCRIWDIWIVERSFKIFFRVAIAVLFLSQPVLLNLDAEGMMNYLNTFPDSTLLDKNILIPCALGFKVTNSMVTAIEISLEDSIS